ncbi:MAG TPA: hypothetical protein VI636_23395 [Candidatus Angelobacter sp.]
MNRKSLLFVGILLLLVAFRYASGQSGNDVVGWDPGYAAYDDPAEWIFSVMMVSPLFGAVIGAMRVVAQRSARPVVQPICLR